MQGTDPGLSLVSVPCNNSGADSQQAEEGTGLSAQPTVLMKVNESRNLASRSFACLGDLCSGLCNTEQVS